MTPRNIKAIARKEFYHLIRDFRSLYLAFMVPLLLILLFGYALSLDVDHVRIVVVDQDRTVLSRDLVRQINASPYFEVVWQVPDARAVVAILDRGRATLGLIIPPRFTERIRAEQESPLQVLIDGSDPNYAGLSRSYVIAFMDAYNQRRLNDFLNRRNLDEINPPVDGRIRVWFNENLESRAFIVPGIIAIIIMIVGAMLTSLVIAREYENGTMETILSLPVSAGEFFFGKALPYFFIALIDVLIAILMGQLLFQIVIKSNFWLMILASSIYICVALSLGLLISLITKSQLVANQVAILVTYLPSLLLSDFVFPIGNMPTVLQQLTRIVPATYFIDILNGLYLRNIGLKMLWPSYLVLAVMFAALCLLNLFFLKREGL